MNSMHKFELYTEQKDNLADLAAEIFPAGFTLIPNQIGVWKGDRELSVCIAVVTDGGPDAELARISMRELARKINTVNNQQATLVFETVGWGEMVTERF